jgi:Rieske Fe-S protein
MALSRRDLLVNTTAGCASFAAAGLMSGCGFDVSPAQQINVTLISDSTDAHYGQIAVPISQNQIVTLPDSAVILNYAVPPSLPFNVPADGVLLVHRGSASDPPEYVAVAASCPHAGCPLSYSTNDKQIACPCHGSRFVASDPTGCTIGQLVRGPALSGVSAFNVDNTSDPTTLYVDLRSAPMCNNGMFMPTVMNGQVVLPFADIPALSNPGGSWVGQPQGLGDTLVVIRVTQTMVVALSAVCTHLQCIVAYVMANSDLECPCHGSKYNLSGTVTMGPAVLPLKQYTATLNAQNITVTVM